MEEQTQSQQQYQRSANLTRSLVRIFEEGCSSNFLFNVKIPSLCGMLGYRPTTYAVTRQELSGTFPILFILSIKSLESGKYDQPFALVNHILVIQKPIRRLNFVIMNLYNQWSRVIECFKGFFKGDVFLQRNASISHIVLKGQPTNFVCLKQIKD